MLIKIHYLSYFNYDFANYDYLDIFNTIILLVLKFDLWLISYLRSTLSILNCLFDLKFKLRFNHYFLENTT